MTPQNITCDYCASRNPEGSARCIACGAPLTIPVIPPITVTVVDKPVAASVGLPPDPSLSQQLKEGAAVVGSGLGLMGITSLVLRSVAESVAIAIAAFIIGLNAGQYSSPYHLLLGALGGAILGLCVGLVSKRIIFTLLSAPLGALLGTVIAIVLQLNQTRTPWMALFSLAGGVLLALLGGHRSSGGLLSCYQKMRPFLGLIGGLLFGLLGHAAGFRIY